MKKKIILIIDEDLITVKTITEYLQDIKFHFEIIHASKAYSALEIAHSVIPDLIILTCELSDMSGFDIIKRLKTNPVTQDISIIVTASQSTFVNDLYETLSEWPVHYLSKPISNTNLQVQVSTVLALSNPLKEIEKQKRIISHMKQFTFSLIDNIPIPLFYQKNDSSFFGCNKAFELLFKKSRQEIVGKTLYDILPKSISDLLQKGLANQIQNTGDLQFTTEVKEGAINRYMMVRCSTFHKGENEYSGCIGVITDITTMVMREKDMWTNTIENIKDELSSKQKELSVYLELLKHVEIEVEKMLEDIATLRPYLNDKGKGKLPQILRNYKHVLKDDSWFSLQRKFEETNFSFFELLEKKWPSITKNEKTLCAYIKMGLTPSEISKISHRSLNSINVALTRLREKANIHSNKDLKVCLLDLKSESPLYDSKVMSAP